MLDKERIKALAAEHSPRAVELRRQIHQYPELGYEEVRTAALVREELNRLGLEVHDFPGTTAVMGILRGKGEGPVVGLRADMDALPLEERTGLPFASKNPGVMHACGHDAHTAILLGTAAMLAELREELSGTVKLFFQPAEEADGGARDMIAAGCMENPRVEEVYGLHVSGRPVGTVRASAGPIYAASDDFTVRILGKKSHGAHPESGIDAVYAAAQVITALHALPSRRVGATDSVSINVGSIHGGVVHNIICDLVELKIMFRSLKQETRDRVIGEMKDLIHAVCKAHGATAEIDRTVGYDGHRNEEYLVDRLRTLTGALLGPDAFEPEGGPSMGTEDFCYFGQAAPSVFYHLGADNAPGHPETPGHSSEFTINEDAIEIGMTMQTALVLDGLERLAGR